jgi:L-iditol 2-dehydrogenase
MIEAVSVAVHAVTITPVRLNDTAVVVGSGMIGVLVIQALLRAGCGRVIAVDIDENRLRLARSLGASETVNPETSAVPGDADIAVEVVGASPSLRTAVHAVRKGGAVTLIGNLSPAVELPLQPVVTRQIRLQGSCASSGEYPACIAMLASGAIRVDPLISAVAPLAEGPAWFSRLYAREPGLTKVILKP